MPFIITGEKGALDLSGEQGALADVAPTVLAIMDIPKPDGEWHKREVDAVLTFGTEMTGKSLLAK